MEAKIGKRSDFQRVERDWYPTPYEAVAPLLSHLKGKVRYAEPCCGDGALVYHLGKSLHECVYAADVENRGYGYTRGYEALTSEDVIGANYIITNPPWDRKLLHPMIEHFCALKPTWLLFDADWLHTKQSARFMPWLVKIVSVGRVKWIPDSKMTGKDNCAWMLFDEKNKEGTQFHGRV